MEVQIVHFFQVSVIHIYSPSVLVHYYHYILTYGQLLLGIVCFHKLGTIPSETNVDVLSVPHNIGGTNILDYLVVHKEFQSFLLPICSHIFIRFCSHYIMNGRSSG